MLLLGLLLVLCIPPTACTPSVACTPSTYYSDIFAVLSNPSAHSIASLDNTLRTKMKTPHTVIPYTSTSIDCWDALSILDADLNTPNSVLLIYKQTADLISNQGLSSGWNREHCDTRALGGRCLVAGGLA